jgi:glycosyltransferase involved in cell wall biosynthesis
MPASALPSITVITPSYNQAEFLEYAIQSVLAQDIQDLEYIIVDGGSSDGSVDIIRKYEDHLAWWVSEADSGQAEAINKGFARARGEYIAWLNSDDMYAPGALDQALDVLRANPEVGLVFGNAASFTEDGYPLNDMIFKDYQLADLMAFNIICQPAVIFRKEILEQAGYLNQDFHYMLDHHLWLRMASLTKIMHVPRLWAFARHHTSAKNVAQPAGFGREALEVLAWMETQPDMRAIIEHDPAPIYAGAYRFNARYLLDSKQAWPALKAYLKSFFRHPKTALQEWHRMLFAVLSLIGLAKMGSVYYRLQENRVPISVQALGVENLNQLYQEQIW